MVVIMIAGNKGAGKDFLATKLIKELGTSVGRVSFARPLKEIVSKTFNVSIEDVDKLKNNNAKVVISCNRGSRIVTALTMRELLQQLGTDALRQIVSDTLWIDLVKKYINSHPELEYIIIPDFRFENEYFEMIKDYNVLSVKVDGGDTNDTHQSENDLKEFTFDLYVDNTNKKDIDIVPILEAVVVFDDD